MTGLDTLGLSAAFVVVTVLGATNPLERRLLLTALARHEHDRTARAWGAAAAFGVYVVVAVAADGLLDWLQVSAPTARVAAGLVLAVRALADLAGLFPGTRMSPPDGTGEADPAPGPGEADTGGGSPTAGRPRRSRALRRGRPTGVRWLVPIAFPVLLRPELALLVVAFAASDRAWWCLGALAVGLGAFVVVADHVAESRLARPGARAIAGVTAALAVATVIGGVLDL